MGGIDAKNPEPGMQIKGKLGTYRLVKRIGGGGNGTVFSVEVTSHEKGMPLRGKFVIKIFTANSESVEEREKRKRRFEKEIKTVYEIQDKVDGIIPIYDDSGSLEKRGEFSWYLMPRAFPYNFKEIRSTEQKLKDMKAVGDCIVQLHKKGLAHRDIKPRNLLVYNNRVCLSDFGLVWNMNDAEEHITDLHDTMGPMAIRPPELRNIENPDGTDYKKSDVYLFAKTVWIVLTGEKGGFHEEYRRSNEYVHLHKKKLQVETAEPLHEMMESATRHYWWERIDMDACVRHIDDQLNIIANRVSDIDLGKWKYDETVKGICETISPDVQMYQDVKSVLEILEKMAGTVNLVFEEAGKAYEPMLLKGGKILSGNLFELDIRNIYANRKKILVNIEKISIMKDLTCIIDTKAIINQLGNMSVFTNLNEAFQSVDKQICISGIYSIRLIQTGSSL